MGYFQGGWTLLFLVLLTAAAALGAMLFRTKVQLDATRRQLLVLQELDEVSRSRAVAEGFYSNVLEADVSRDRLIGGNCRALAALLELPEEASFSDCIAEILERFIKEEHRELYRKNFDRQELLRRFAEGERKFTFEFEERADLVHYCWTRVTVCLYYSELTRSVKLVSYVKNIQEEREREQALIHAAATDPLTGLLNRRETERRVNGILKEEGELQHGLLVIDVDRFKQINDLRGHALGDEVLRTVGRLIQEQFRQEDAVGRIGGDEFLVLMRNCHGEQELMERAETLVSRTASLHRQGCTCAAVTLSVGAAMYPQHGEGYERLFAAADTALYAAKAKGRDGWFLAETEGTVRAETGSAEAKC